MLRASVKEISEEEVLLIVEVMDGERVRSRREYHLAKLPFQSAQEVCRAVCPEAFQETEQSTAKESL
jgi:hypothetical protein